MVLGKSGAGKTLCTVALVAQLLARGAQGVVVDRADHYQFLCQLIPGARHLTLGGGDGEHAINPWDTPDPGRVPAEKVSFLLDLHALLLGDPHSGADDYGLTTHEHVVLEAAIRGVYQHAHETGAVARERDLQVELARRAGVERDRGASRLADAAEDLALRLGAFVGDGTYAHLTDRPTTVAGDAPLVVFDTRKVSERLAAAVIFLIGEHTAEGIDARARARTHAGLPADAIFGKSFLVLEEVWALIARAVTGRWVNDMASRSRHLGLALVAVTQQLDDFAGSRHGQALLRQASMQLHFKQSAEALQAIQAAGGLSDEERRLIGRLKTVKRQFSQAYWLNGARGRGVIEMRHAPAVYWLATSDPINDVPQRTRALAANQRRRVGSARPARPPGGSGVSAPLATGTAWRLRRPLGMSALAALLAALAIGLAVLAPLLSLFGTAPGPLSAPQRAGWGGGGDPRGLPAHLPSRRAALPRALGAAGRHPPQGNRLLPAARPQRPGRRGVLRLQRVRRRGTGAVRDRRRRPLPRHRHQLPRQSQRRRRRHVATLPRRRPRSPAPGELPADGQPPARVCGDGAARLRL